MSDLISLHAELVECRWRVMGVIADWHEEHGDAATALAWRWLARHRKWPTSFETTGGWRLYWKYNSHVKTYTENQGTLPGDGQIATFSNESVALQEAAAYMAIVLARWAQEGKK